MEPQFKITLGNKTVHVEDLTVEQLEELRNILTMKVDAMKAIKILQTALKMIK